MIELLAAAAEDNPDHRAVVSPAGEITYAELAARADAVASYLLDHGLRRVGVLEPDPATIMAVLAGSARIGAEACVYPLNATADVVDRLAERFDHSVVITDRTSHHARSVPIAEVLGTALGDLPTERPPSRPVMVLTTGTTGEPKGVRHEWDRLLRAVSRTYPTPKQRWLLAYGLNQFGGLQIMLHVLAAQATLVAGESFQPKDALVAAREWDVTHISGTATFWRFLITQMASDGGPIPPVEQVTLGGEAVPANVLARIRETWPEAKISQIYVATEFGQGVTVRDGLPGLPVSLLESGGDVEFKVIDGELHVRSRSSMLGYHGEAPVDAEAWRPTGDLVEVVGDRVEFRGRNTDVINVGGVKIHPLPIEERVGSVPGVAAVRAFGRTNALTGAVVALELVLEPGHDEDDVDAAVREACADLPPAAQPRSIRFVESMTTTGNKLSRGTA